MQSVPARRQLRHRLLEQLPPAVVIEDEGPPPGNPWRGYQLCLSRFMNHGSWSHAVIVQDDALLCRNFEPALEDIVEICPANPVCLFYPGLRMHSARTVQRARGRGSTLFQLHPRDFVPMVAVLWPREKAAHFLRWSQGAKIPGLRAPYRSDDAVAGGWMRLTKQDVFVTLPSLVQHPDDAASVKDGPHEPKFGRDKGRIALSFCEGDPLEIDWRF